MGDRWDFDDEDMVDPSVLDHLVTQWPDLALFTVFIALALFSFYRKSIPLKYATLVFSVAFLGVYKSSLVSIVNVMGAFGGIVPLHIESILFSGLVLFTLIATVLWGRVYCGRICAFGALTQLLDAIMPRRLQFEVPAALEKRASYIKFFILFGAIGAFLLTQDVRFYRYIEPFWLFSFEASTLLWIGLGVLLIASLFVRNLYCRFLCPLGAALGLLSKVSVFRIKRWSECSTCQLCEKKCEWGAIRQRQIIMAECVRCDECEILYASKTRCPHWLLEAKRQRRGSV